ncbi:MAG: DNA primase [Ectothiorhodospiraceae bacterium]|jgi:DNA primase|nr:DNA primase [Ectothiorhodospiraceae bacterium]
MARIPQTFIDELLTRVDIVDVIDARVPLKKKGKDYMACCPFHSEKSPSFSVSRDKQFYHCFGCGAHGTAVGFLMEYEHMDFVEAVETLARQAGLEVPREGGDGPRESHEALYAALTEAAAFYRRQLKGAPEAVDYLKGRGLSGEIAAEFGLGYAPDQWDALIQQLGERLTPAVLVRAGLAVEKEGGRLLDRFRGRVMFPIRDSRGRIIGFGGRVLGKGEPKYLNSPETPVFHKGSQLYGLYEARKATGKPDHLLVVEGYMDVIALAQHGIRNAVATLGTATTREHLERLFRTTPRIVFCFDGDRAGRQAAWRALEQALPLMQDGREVGFLFLPEGEDPDTLVRKEGAAGLQARIAEALPLSDFLLKGLAEQHNVASREGRARMAAAAGTLVKPMPEGFLKQQIVRDLARMLDLADERLNREWGSDGTQGRPNLTPPPAPRSRRDAPKGQKLRMTPLRMALALLVQNPKFAERAGNCADLDDLEEPGIHLLLTILETLREHPHLTTAGLLERWRDSEEWPHLLKLAHWQPPADDPSAISQMFDDSLRTLRRLRDERRTETLLRQAAQEPLTPVEKSELQALLGRGRPGGNDVAPGK